MMTLHLEVVTPDQVVYKDDVDEVILPTKTGQIAVLPNHIPLLSQLDSGEMIIKKNGKERYMAITGGFIEVSKNTISILADFAVDSEKIEIAKAEEARKRAEKVMQEKAGDKDFAVAEAEFRRAILELHVAKRRRRNI
jgi:F-type H+-transporting ATPase subunit epsilon